MKKSFFLVLLCIGFLINTFSYGQSGFIGGADYTWLKAAVMEGSKYDKNNGMEGWKPTFAYHFGYQWSFTLGSCARINIGSLFERKGAKSTPMGLTYDDYTPEDYLKDTVFLVGPIIYSKTMYNYLSFPLYMDYCFGGSFRAGIGGTPSIIITDPLNNYAHNYFDFSLRMKFSYTYHNLEYSLEYQHGMLNVFKNTFIKYAYQRGISFSISYKINKKK